MRIHLGAEIERPTIAVSLHAEDMHDLRAMPAYDAIVEDVLNSKLLNIAECEDGYEATFQLRKIRSLPELRQHAAIRQVAQTLGAMTSLRMDEESSLQDVYVGTRPQGPDGRLALGLSLTWPDHGDAEIAHFATGVMRKVGKYIGYDKRMHLSDRAYAESVYALVRRYRDEETTNPWAASAGVTLQTLPIGSCSIDTDGSEYAPEEPRFWLHQHNIYNHQQQLICLAGAIAISEVDKVLANQ